MKSFVDKTFFDEAILEIGEPVIVWTRKKVELNEYGEIENKYEKYQIYGSLQPESNSRSETGKGSSIEQLWNFYCGSEYRLYIDDIIETENGEYLEIYEYTPYNNFGVRECKCKALTLSETRNLLEFKKHYEENLK